MRITFLKATLIATAGLVAPLSAAATTSQDDSLRMFAICAGRFEAAEAHQRLFTKTSPSDHQNGLALATALLEALMLPSEAEATQSWRGNAKADLTSLLSQATLSFDAAAALRAQKVSERLIRECQSYLHL